MKDLKDKVAVITGAASGIGRAIAEGCARRGMKVVLADIEEEPLFGTAREMKDGGATVLAVPTDVSKGGDVEALARKTLDAFKAVHLLCNNAGVGPFNSILGSTAADWEWIMSVNLWSVIHGVRIFTPIMLGQNTDCHIVNTASRAGLICGPTIGIYRVTKHGVVALSETLYHELMERGAKIMVSVLCPSFVNTRILDAERNRPPELRNDPSTIDSPEKKALEAKFRQVLEKAKATSAAQVADLVFEAIRERKFYILPHPELKDLVRLRMEDILLERNPSSPPQ